MGLRSVDALWVSVCAEPPGCLRVGLRGRKLTDDFFAMRPGSADPAAVRWSL